jgi:hypothetical protein
MYITPSFSTRHTTRETMTQRAERQRGAGLAISPLVSSLAVLLQRVMGVALSTYRTVRLSVPATNWGNNLLNKATRARYRAKNAST